MPNSPEEMSAEVLAALGHPNRIRILMHLRGAVKCNCELAPQLGLEQSNLSRHLKILERAGVLTSRREGLRVQFKVADERILQILDLATEVARRASVERIKAIEPQGSTFVNKMG